MSNIQTKHGGSDAVGLQDESELGADIPVAMSAAPESGSSPALEASSLRQINFRRGAFLALRIPSEVPQTDVESANETTPIELRLAMNLQGSGPAVNTVVALCLQFKVEPPKTSYIVEKLTNAGIKPYEANTSTLRVFGVVLSCKASETKNFQQMQAGVASWCNQKGAGQTQYAQKVVQAYRIVKQKSASVVSAASAFLQGKVQIAMGFQVGKVEATQIQDHQVLGTVFAYDPITNELTPTGEEINGVLDTNEYEIQYAMDAESPVAKAIAKALKAGAIKTSSIGFNFAELQKAFSRYGWLGVIAEWAHQIVKIHGSLDAGLVIKAVKAQVNLAEQTLSQFTRATGKTWNASNALLPNLGLGQGLGSGSGMGPAAS